MSLVYVELEKNISIVVVDYKLIKINIKNNINTNKVI